MFRLVLAGERIGNYPTGTFYLLKCKTRVALAKSVLTWINLAVLKIDIEVIDISKELEWLHGNFI